MAVVLRSPDRAQQYFQHRDSGEIRRADCRSNFRTLQVRLRDDPGSHHRPAGRDQCPYSENPGLSRLVYGARTAQSGAGRQRQFDQNGSNTMKRLGMAITFLAVAAGAYGAWWWSQGSSAPGGKKGKGKGGVLTVKAARAVVKPMPVLIEAVGTVEPEHSVQIRAQVSGVLQSVNFKEGDKVKAGQQLFQIDPRTYDAVYRQAQAQLARDVAQLENAKVQQDRLAPLLKNEFITRQEFDVAVTSTKSLEATVAADRTLVEQARIQLEYSRIVAPIAGRTGALSIKEGNLVAAGAGGGAPLVTINSTDPILVTFSIPERQLEELRRYQNEKEMRIEILPEKSGPSVAEGKLVFIDNTVTPQTGTVLLKTRVTNKDEILWPGQFANVRIVLKIEPEAVVLPEAAV